MASPAHTVDWQRLCQALNGALYCALDRPGLTVTLSMMREFEWMGDHLSVDPSITYGERHALGIRIYGSIAGHLRRIAEAHAKSLDQSHLPDSIYSSRAGHDGSAPSAHDRIALTREIELLGLPPTLIPDLERIIDNHR